MGSLDYNFNAASAVNESARNDTSNSWGYEPATILPVQFFGKGSNSGRTQPVMRLMFAVLEDAVRCFERDLRARSVSRRRRFLEAEDWLFRQSESAGLFSFESVCEVLDIDRDGIRRALWLWRETALSTEAPAKLLYGVRHHQTQRRTSVLPFRSRR
jgi:hypothetical protein